MKNDKRFQVSWSMYTNKIKNSSWWEKVGSIRAWYTDGKMSNAVQRAMDKVTKPFK